MIYRAPSTRSPIYSLLKFLCPLALILPLIGSALTRVAGQNNDALHFELPANGNLRVENLRGAVIAEIWNGNYVSVSAISDNGQAVNVPPVVDRGETLLAIRLGRRTANASPVNLVLRVPARAHLSITTGAGSIEVTGLPAALLAQSGTGEIRLNLPRRAGANVVADSKTGSVVSSITELAANRGAVPQLRGRIGDGANSIRLYSQAGNIVLAPAVDVTARTVQPQAPRTAQLGPTERPRPRQRPDLVGPDRSATPAGTPAPPDNGPVEVSEGDVIRVDTELVSVNVSVVDRGTNRGVNDLTKDDFRLYEDNAPQQIAHFESSSAPFNLVLLIDLSGSTTKVVDLIKSAALHFVDAARPFDRIGVITFAGGQVVVSSLTTDHDALRERIRAIQKPDGSTKLYDSVSFAIDEVFREAKDSRRNAIVVISDGLDSVLPNVTGEGSQTSYEEMIRRAKEFDGVIYSIWTDTQSYEPLSPLDIQQETFDLGHDRMKELSDAGGGAFYESAKIEDLAGSYDRVVADLGTLYTLSYRPTNKVRDGSWRTIRVNTNRPNTVARGKRGYFAK
ncbi:MAG TPA: VWA domain-containing protein [Pyrinomonadaceae bacterium]|nr:VWA domain-containing protein [Pyrinomonadaceae bacterium]